VQEYVTRRVLVERITLVFPTHQRDRVLADLARAGYRAVRSGPYTDETIWPDVDPARQLVEAHREVSS